MLAGHAQGSNMGTFWAPRRLPFRLFVRCQLSVVRCMMPVATDRGQRTNDNSLENRYPVGAVLKCWLANLVKTKLLRETFQHDSNLAFARGALLRFTEDSIAKDQ